MTSAKFEIEKGIPIPEARRLTGYPFVEMEVGDSFFVRKKIDQTPWVFQRRLSSCCIYWGKKGGVKFSTHIVKGGVRVWRIK